MSEPATFVKIARARLEAWWETYIVTPHRLNGAIDKLEHESRKLDAVVDDIVKEVRSIRHDA